MALVHFSHIRHDQNCLLNPIIIMTIMRKRYFASHSRQQTKSFMSQHFRGLGDDWTCFDFEFHDRIDIEIGCVERDFHI